MWSPLATVLLTWAAVYGYVGTYYCMLYGRRPTQREYLAFGLMAFGIAAWTVGGALGVDAETADDATFALQLQYLGGFSAVAYFVDFGVQISGYSARRFVAACYVTALVGIALDVTGLMFSDGPLFVVSLPGSTAGSASMVSLSPLGAALAGVGLLFPLVTLFLIAGGTRRSPDLRALLVTTAIVVLGSVFDLAAVMTPLPQVHLVEHASLLQVVTVSFVLLRRFVRSADELAKRTDELRISYGELRVVQDELVRKEQLAAVGELSAVIAHEVRNPLAIIKNAVSSLRRPSLRTEDRTILLSILDEEVDRLSRLVRDLLAYARPVTPRGQTVDLRELIERALADLLGPRDPDDGIEIEIHADGVPPLRGDPELLAQAIGNVADNSLQAMPRGGKLRIEAAADGEDAIRIAFRDTGLGMSEEDRAKALDPFFTTRPAGTGLGLAIVQRVIRNHAGTVSLTSTPGEGTEVVFVLPRAGRPR